MNRFLVGGAVSALLSCISGAPVLSQESLSGRWALLPDSRSESPADPLHLLLFAPPGDRNVVGLRLTRQESEALFRRAVSSGGGEVRRDAGTFSFEGEVKDGHGSGSFVFTPDAAFAAAIAKRGLGRPTLDQQFWLALYDADLAGIDALNAAGFGRLALAEVVRLNNHRVTATYVSDLRALGYDRLSLDQVIRLRDQDVSAAFIRELRELGYTQISLSELERLRMFNVTPAFIRQVNAKGGGRRPVDELVRLRTDRRRG